MGKNKKKRDKAYKGPGAATVRPAVTRIDAVNRNRVSQWWVEHKRIAKPVGIASGVVVVIAILVVEAVRLITG